MDEKGTIALPDPSAAVGLVAEARSAFAAGDTAAARARLGKAAPELESLRDDDVAAYAGACEEAGMLGEAVRACRLLLSRDMRRADAWERLGSLHEEMGDAERAGRCRARAREAVEGPGASGAAGAPGIEVAPAPGGFPALRFDRTDLVRFADLFRGREDVHARQWFDRTAGRAGYAPVREPLSAAVARSHLEGRQTVGTYLVRADDTVTFCVLDLDLSREAVVRAEGDADRVADLGARLDRAGRSLCGALGQLGVPFLYEDSGYKGRHLWIFLDEPSPAEAVRAFGAALVRAHRPQDPDLRLEFFPKQSRVEPGGLGNLVKLPLGFHKVSGRRAWLLRADGTVHQDPAGALRSVRRWPAGRLAEVTVALLARRAVPDPAAPPDDPGGLPGAPSPDGRPAGPSRRAAPAPPPWTEEDFERHPEVSAVLAGCGVLARLVERALAGDALGHDALLVARHTLGHLEDGPRAVNFLLGRMSGVGEEQILGRTLRGNPMSCGGIRRRVPGVCRRTGCDCDFGGPLPTYPNPLLHLPIETESATLLPEVGPEDGFRGPPEDRPDGPVEEGRGSRPEDPPRHRLPHLPPVETAAGPGERADDGSRTPAAPGGSGDPPAGGAA